MTDNHKLTRAEQAIAFHNKGYNCAQSVIFAFADQCNADPETLFKITEGLGLGMGGMDGTCGAISAAAVLSGLLTSTANLETPRALPIRKQEPVSRPLRKKIQVLSAGN